MKVKYSILKTLDGFNCPPSYTVISKEEVTKNISHNIPITTGFCCSRIPSYLKGFEDYYNEEVQTWGSHTTIRGWRLKPEYLENRPQYTISITYTLYDVEFTKKGKDEIKRRYNIHKRNLEKYASLMG